MKTEIKEHPAVLFGQWLREKRLASGTVARVFAGRINLTQAEYAEVESGVVHWIKEKQENLIPVLLGLRGDDQAAFSHKLFLAREEKELLFSDIYSKEELSPARCCTADGKQIDATTKEAIIKAVFTPLARGA